MIKKIVALTEALKKLETLEAEANRAEAAYEAEPENAEAETAFDAAYSAEYAAFMEAAEALAEVSGGKIDDKAAREMIRTRRAEVAKILSSAA